MGKLHGALALVLFALACGPKTTAKPPAATPTPGDKKDFKPLGIKADAKAPNQAVILGTDDKNGSTIIKLPNVETFGKVDAMFVRMGGGQPASGGSSPVKLSTGPNADRSVRVGLYEELAGGAGPQWRAGVWVAAITAANTLGKDLTDFSFSASSGGYIDGASASGLMTAGFLATMTGATIDPLATMTGIINPDGTIGPVGGIPEKFKGNIDKGKKRIGFPIGSRLARSAATGRMVDLVELAKENGAEAVEVASVFEAYRLLTGKSLPEPVPVTAKEMQLDEDTNKALNAKYAEWLKRYGEELETLLKLQQAGRLPAALLTMGKRAVDLAESADKMQKQGFAYAAYQKLLEAWVYAASATDAFDILTKLQNGDGDQALRSINSLDELEKTTIEIFKKVGAMKPTTMGGHLMMMGAYQAALKAWGYKMFANTAVQNTRMFVAGLARRDATALASQEVADAIIENVAPTVVLIGRTVAETALAAQRMEFESEKSINYMCNIPNVKRMTTSYQSASAAGINYFETLIGIKDDFTRQRAAMREPNYLVSYMLSRMDLASSGVMADLKKEWGDKSLQWNLMSLAGGELAYAKSAELVIKYYSLGVKPDAAGRAIGVEHEKAFLNMLITAERTARANARAARIATGAIPVQAKLAYQMASMQREGDMQDKLEALSGFWTASAYSQTAVMLARN
jgi:hypothetical protein